MAIAALRYCNASQLYLLLNRIAPLHQIGMGKLLLLFISGGAIALIFLGILSIYEGWVPPGR